MSNEVELLSQATNIAVVQLPGRQYPGVVFQGDSLHLMLTQVSEMKDLIARSDISELQDSIANLEEMLGEVATYFEHICTINGRKIPY